MKLISTNGRWGAAEKTRKSTGAGRRVLSIVLTLVLVLSLVPSVAPLTAYAAENEPGFAGGTGGPLEPYRISTPEQLTLLNNKTVRDRFNHYVLVNDINLTGNWTPIDNFHGHLDGQGYTIRGLTTSGRQYAGLFGRIDAESVTLPSNVNPITIKNLTVEIAPGGVNAYYNSNINANYYSQNPMAGFAGLPGGSGSPERSICANLLRGNLRARLHSRRGGDMGKAH